MWLAHQKDTAHPESEVEEQQQHNYDDLDEVMNQPQSAYYYVPPDPQHESFDNIDPSLGGNSGLMPVTEEEEMDLEFDINTLQQMAAGLKDPSKRQ